MSKTSLFDIKVNLKLGILGLCIIGALLFVVCYYFFPARREGVKFVGSALTIAVAIYTAYHVAESLEVTRTRQKQESAYRFLEFFNQNDWVEVRDALESVSDAGAAHTAQYTQVKTDKILRQQLIRLLGLFEDISIAIQNGYADEKILYDSLANMVPRYYCGFLGYISELRKRENAPNYYCEFEKLKTAWVSRKYLYDSRNITDAK